MRSTSVAACLALLASTVSVVHCMPFQQGTTPTVDLGSDLLSRSHAGHLRHHGRNSGQVLGLGSRSAGSVASSTSSRRHHALGKRSNKKRCTKKGKDSVSSNSASSSSSSASSANSNSTSSADDSSSSSTPSGSGGSSSGCFPALDFKMPSDTPGSTDNWWCDQSDEYAFLGFSYDVSGCQSLSQLRKDFKDMKQTYNSRYVRIYNGCDNDGYNDQLVKAAWENGLGLHSLIFFGYDGGDQWKTRKSQLLNTMKNNPKAPYVVRAIVVGSEPMFDNVLPASQLAGQINDIKSQLKSVAPNTQVTLSDMPYAYSIQSPSDRKAVVNAVDVLEGNILPFFDQAATTASASWTNVLWNINYFKDNGSGKKILMTQTGWPSNTATWPANSKSAVTSVSQEKKYFDLLDSKCSWMKQNGPKGGIGWFAHIYEDSTLPGWGILKNGKPKFDFKPRTSC